MRLWHRRRRDARLSAMGSATSRDAVAAVLAGTGAFLPPFLEGVPVPALELTAFSLAVAAPLAIRRRLPLVAAFAAVAVAIAGARLPGWPGQLVAALALCSAAYHRPRHIVVIGLLALACFATPTAVTPPGQLAEEVFRQGRRPASGMTPFTEAVVLAIAPVALGYALRLRQQRTEQAARLRLAEAGRELAEQRAMIAREVHDTVGHHLTAIRLQAGAARHVVTDASPVVQRTLGTVVDLASAALDEVRALLAMLRGDTAPLGTGALADVRALVTRLSTPKCPITISMGVPPGRLPEEVDRAAFRVVREALTNAVRHACAKNIRLHIEVAADKLVVTVDDDGRAGPPGQPVSAGQGIMGMRQSVAGVGGTLQITARKPRGWRVRARMPLGPETER